MCTGQQHSLQRLCQFWLGTHNFSMPAMVKVSSRHGQPSSLFLIVSRVIIQRHWLLCTSKSLQIKKKKKAFFLPSMGLGWVNYSKSFFLVYLLYVGLSIPRKEWLTWCNLTMRNSTSKKRGYRIILLSPLHVQSHPGKDESHTYLLLVHLSFPCWFNRELNIIKEKKGRKIQTLQTLHFRGDRGKYVFKNKYINYK